MKIKLFVLLRNLIIKLSTRRKVRMINKALGIKLMPWQIDYIFNDVDIPNELENARRSGTTTARAIKLCLSEGDTISLMPVFNFYWGAWAGLSVKKQMELMQICYIAKPELTDRQRYKFFVYEALKIKYLLSQNAPKLKLRDIRRNGIQ